MNGRSQYPLILQRMRELSINQSDLSEILDISHQAVSNKFTGKAVWTEPQMQMVLEYIGKPEETLADFFPRRRVCGT